MQQEENTLGSLVMLDAIIILRKFSVLHLHKTKSTLLNNIYSKPLCVMSSLAIIFVDNQ